MNRKRKKTFSFFLWHRRLGLAAMLFIIILAITGIMLNHTESLSLDESMVESNWLLDWYELNPKSNPVSFTVNESSVTQWDEQIFLNDDSLLTTKQQLQGTVAIDDMIAIALTNAIILIDTDGELIEQIDTQSEFPDIEHLGINQNTLVVKTSNNQYFQSDEQILKWSPTIPSVYTWSVTTQLADTEQTKLLQSYRGTGLTLERVILDLHSGRIFNAQWGVYIMDASAIVILWLGVSGIWVWSSRRRKMKSKRHYQKHHR